MASKSTRFLGSNEPLQIFHDDFLENSAPMTSHAPMPNVTKIRRPLTNSNANVVLNPPSLSSNPNSSPYKAKASSSKSPLGSSQGNKLNMVSMAPPMTQGPITDSLQKKQPRLSKFKTGQAPTSFVDPTGQYEKENIHPPIFPAPPALNLPVDAFYQKPNKKRSLMDAAPIKDSRPVKKAKTKEQVLSPHAAFPAIVDDGNKPSFSYAQLIALSIMDSPNGRRTLSQIYKWISDNFSFYGPNDAGWQNSIRHNLSLQKSFVKIERPKDDPGKGNYWTIEPGHESLFLKEKPTRKSAPSHENISVMSTRLEPSQPQPMLMPEPSLPPPMPLSMNHFAALPPLPTSQATLSMPLEASSDATILASDNPVVDETADKGPENEPSFYSPLPANLHSSPPGPRPERHSDTPTTKRDLISSISLPYESRQDSGYMSAQESSVLRPNPKSGIFTSEADRRRLSGRAEEEIARLRGSSPFSPTKPRSFSYGPASSSPLRQSQQLLPPLTPVVKIKPPVRPPPSVSPSTNLRLHRARVQTLLDAHLQDMAEIGGDVPLSPAFNLDEPFFSLDGLPTTPGNFEIYQDSPANDESNLSAIGSAATGSPIKRSGKRARLGRNASRPTLGEIANSARKQALASAPLVRIEDETPLETPSKAFEGLSSPSKAFQESPSRTVSPDKFNPFMNFPETNDWQNLMPDASDFGIDATGDVSEFGFDITQGFERIGGSQSVDGSSKSNKPGLGRSYSTTF
ncbi:Forkhead protein sep1 [Cladobotryum mycophilum]|uniref:Forkhead protein sep1 n=1 Tax=Cladobotryum mycophilum TaxID=491253 RepID=A0ABR0SEQ7_9HYPO